VTIADIPPSASAGILARLNHLLKEHFHICHATIQFEHTSCKELNGCVVPMEEMAGDPSLRPRTPPRSHALRLFRR
jgi:cobalt-zinc-cadmium efflux system protein